MHRRRRDGDVIEYPGYRLPERQRRQMLDVEWHHARIAGFDARSRACLEPPAPVACENTAIGAHDVDLTLVGAPGQSAALRDIVVARKPRLVEKRGGILHLTQDRDLLLESRNDELISIPN